MAENIPDNKPKTVRRPRLKLPFDNRKEDAGVWAYDHRIGLCVTIIAYLVLMIAFVSSKIVVGRRFLHNRTNLSAQEYSENLL